MNLATPTNRVLQRRNSLTRLGALCSGNRQEILNGDVRDYGGSGQGNFGGVEASIIPSHGRPASLNVTLPPLAVVCFKSAGA
jgi:1,4-alpha-glucan branching enzyme